MGGGDVTSDGVWKMAQAWLSKRAAWSRSKATRPKKMDGNKRKNRVASKADKRARGSGSTGCGSGAFFIGKREEVGK